MPGTTSTAVPSFSHDQHHETDAAKRKGEPTQIDQTNNYDFLLVFYSIFVPKMHRFRDIWLQKCCDLENRVRGPSRSLKISPFDRAHTTSYWCSVVIMTLSPVFSETFNVEKCRDLEIRVRGHSRSLKRYHSIDWVWFPVSVLHKLCP